ncbi:MAG: peptidoglycan DD-metalloendopeptidase family protein [Candidatus Accumulibacter sp.]|nr:peptidoglycan DD-metalloendopeptidase family protein [Accumulibacter sp.]
MAAVSLLGMAAAFAIAPPTDIIPSQATIIEQLPAPPLLPIASDDTFFAHEERVLASDTVASLLIRLGASDREAIDHLGKDRKAHTLITSNLRPGMIVNARISVTGELLHLSLPLIDKNTVVSLDRIGKRFVSAEQALTLEQRTVIKSGEIRGSFISSSEAAGLPEPIATQLVGLFGNEGSFYRALRQGDRFSVVYESFAYRGQEIRTGRILAAELGNRHRTQQAYWFQFEPGRGAYYNADGKSLSKPFLNAPVENPHVTSGFSASRFHPIFQTWRAHKGVDYAAPTGTKVLAVADGVIEAAEAQNGYGNVIVLRHDPTYSTVYGHLNEFAEGIAKGTRVHQGDVIGYVGRTGWATDSHLHYEFRINDEQVDPEALVLPESITLDRLRLTRFKASRQTLRAQLDLAKEITLASVE